VKKLSNLTQDFLLNLRARVATKCTLHFAGVLKTYQPERKEKRTHTIIYKYAKYLMNQQPAER
jgi:hypothetical protein